MIRTDLPQVHEARERLAELRRLTLSEMDEAGLRCWLSRMEAATQTLVTLIDVGVLEAQR